MKFLFFPNKITVFSVLILLIFNVFGAKAQQKKDAIDPENIDVIKEYEPVLADAIRIEFSPDQPTFEDIKAEKPVFGDYIIPNRLLNNVEYEPAELRPLGYRNDKKKIQERLHNVWVKAGFGTLSTPLLDVAISSGRSNKYVVGLNGSHISSQGTELNFQDYDKSAIDLYSKIFQEKTFVGFDVGYARKGFFNYGFAQNDTMNDAFTKEDLARRYQNLGASFEFGNSIENKAATDFNMKLDYDFYWTQLQAQEHNVIGDAYIAKRFGDHVELGLDVLSHFTTFRPDTIIGIHNDLMTNATPYFTYKSFFGQVKVGGTMILANEEITGFPHLSLEAILVPDRATIFGGWQKQAIKNSFKQISTQNPFVTYDLDLQSSIKEERYLGFKGTIKGVNYSLKGFQYLTEKQPLYVLNTPTTSDTMRFKTIYDDLTTFGGLLELEYQVSEKLRVGLTGNFNIYTPENEAEAWHLPVWGATVSGRFEPIEKLILSADVFVLQGAVAQQADGTIKNLKGVADINLAAKYNIMRNISIFGNVNNVASIKAERYINYPTYGLNALGGVMLRF